MFSMRRIVLIVLATGWVPVALTACRTNIQEAGIPGIEKDEPATASAHEKIADATVRETPAGIVDDSTLTAAAVSASQGASPALRSARVRSAADLQPAAEADFSTDRAQGNDIPVEPARGTTGTTARVNVAVGSTTVDLFLPGTASGDDSSDEDSSDSADESSDDSADDNGNDNGADDSSNDGADESGDDSSDDNENDNSDDSADHNGNDNGADDNSDDADESGDDSSDDNENDNSD
ncbi:MAG: hypothetical protein ACE5EC_09000, partial [Phycisphaerae bacterium]